MRQIVIFTFIVTFSFAKAQNEKNNLAIIRNADVSNIWTTDSVIAADDADFVNGKVVTIYHKYKKPEPLGFIGENYQRFYIHFDTVYKDKTNNLWYNIIGKTKVNSNICNFTGRLSFNEVTLNSQDGTENDYKSYQLIGNYYFFEDSTKLGSGEFKGQFKINIVVDNNERISYDAIDLVSDGFRNNEFIGNWTSYKTRISKKCNWGDYRIPGCGDLDIGVGEFSVNEKYRKFGWQTFSNAFEGNYNSAESQKARLIEKKKWWE